MSTVAFDGFDFYVDKIDGKYFVCLKEPFGATIVSGAIPLELAETLARRLNEKLEEVAEGAQ